MRCLLQRLALLLAVLIILLPQTGSCQFHGVNLGGWLLLEDYITPSLFVGLPAADEWTFCSVNANSTNQLQRLRDHWATFIEEQDIQYMAAGGTNLLRIPMGYWSFMTQTELTVNGDPYLTGAWDIAVRAISWAKKYNVSVLVDLHAAPGCQNPWGHSGRAGIMQWGTGNTINMTLMILQRMAMSIAALESNSSTSGAVTGLALLNEPFSPEIVGGIDTVKNFYLTAYPMLRAILPASRYFLVIDHGFTPDAFPGFMPTPQYENVKLDIHIYHVFTPVLANMSWDQQIEQTCVHDGSVISMQTLPTMIGEFAVGYNVSSNLDYTLLFPNATEQAFLKRFFLAQTYTYTYTTNAAGWLFWSYKVEDHQAPRWDWWVGTQHGWIPYPVDVQLQSQGCQGVTGN